MESPLAIRLSVFNDRGVEGYGSLQHPRRLVTPPVVQSDFKQIIYKPCSSFDFGKWTLNRAVVEFCKNLYM